MSAEQLITKHLDIWTSAHKTRSSAGRGSSSKLDLYGIKKLRELILELAVRGKLVPQDSNDEPVEKLIANFDSKKTAVLNERQVSYRAISEDPDIAAMKYDIPETWEWVRFCDAVFFQEGPGIRNWQFKTAGIKLLNVSNILFTDQLNFDNSDKFVSEEEFETKYKHFELVDGDLLFAGSGASWGKVAWFKNPGFKVMLNTSTMRMSFFDSGFSPNYLYYFVKSPNFKNQLTSQLVGLQPNFGSTHLSRAFIALPPICEQHRIVKKVDELMTFCDELEQAQTDNIAAHAQLVEALLTTLINSKDHQELQANWQRIAEHFDTLFTTEDSIDQLKQTILQLAVMGKLVPQDPNDEPASELLKKIAAEKAQLIKEGKIKKEKQLPEITDEEEPFKSPEGWSWCRLANVTSLITSGSRDWAKYLSDDGAIFVTMANLSRADYKLRTDTMRYVNPPVNGEGARTKLEENDLIVSITGDVGNLGLIPNNFGDAYINQHTCLLRFMPMCQNLYFPELLRSPLAKIQFDTPQRGIKNSFRLSDVGEMIIPLPPLNEQYRIVEQLNILMELCSSLKNNLVNIKNIQCTIATALVEQVVFN